MKDIRVTCHAADVLPVDSLVEFQGNLKTISRENLDKLKRSILRHGFSAPIFVWRGSDNHILDGHQRLRALLEFRQEGYNLPLLPVVFIDAEDEKEAKEKLLYITSQYGDFDKNGFWDFASGLDFDDVRIEGFFEGVGDSEEEIEPKEIQIREYDRIHFLISCDPSEFIEINEIVKQAAAKGAEVEQSAN